MPSALSRARRVAVASRASRRAVLAAASPTLDLDSRDPSHPLSSVDPFRPSCASDLGLCRPWSLASASPLLPPPASRAACSADPLLPPMRSALSPRCALSVLASLGASHSCCRSPGRATTPRASVGSHLEELGFRACAPARPATHPPLPVSAIPGASPARSAAARSARALLPTPTPSANPWRAGLPTTTLGPPGSAAPCPCGPQLRRDCSRTVSPLVSPIGRSPRPSASFPDGARSPSSNSRSRWTGCPPLSAFARPTPTASSAASSPDSAARAVVCRPTTPPPAPVLADCSDRHPSGARCPSMLSSRVPTFD